MLGHAALETGDGWIGGACTGERRFADVFGVAIVAPIPAKLLAVVIAPIPNKLAEADVAPIPNKLLTAVVPPIPAKLPGSAFFRASSTSVARVTEGEDGVGGGTELAVGVGCWMLTVLPVTWTEAEGLAPGIETPPPLGTVVAVTMPRGMVGVEAMECKDINPKSRLT